MHPSAIMIVRTLVATAFGGAAGYCIPLLLCYGVLAEVATGPTGAVQGRLIEPGVGAAPVLVGASVVVGAALGALFGAVTGLRKLRTSTGSNRDED